MTGDKPLYLANSRSLSQLYTRQPLFESFSLSLANTSKLPYIGYRLETYYGSSHSVGIERENQMGCCISDRSWKSDIKSGQTRQEKDGHNLLFYLSSQHLFVYLGWLGSYVIAIVKATMSYGNHP